jgi:DNA-binding transcriptional LysR family regulator
MSLDLESLRIFAKVAELSSFTRAGEQLGMPKARVSLRLKKLEGELGSPLLQRSTRLVRLTPEGEQLLARAHHLLAEADEVVAMFQPARGLRGRVRVDLPVGLARDVIIPRLPELLVRHPELELVVSTTDRRVDAHREGFDLVLRVGPVGDPALVGRRLGLLPMMNCASPGYLRKHGIPHTLDDLEGHWVVHYSSTLGGERPSFEYPTPEGYREKPMRAWVTVNNVDAYTAACVAGLGIIQVPRANAGSPARATLVELLPALTCAPMPVTLLHTHGRNPPRRVRAVASWIAELITPHVAGARG